MLTFESDSLLGAAPIVEKLANLPFRKVKHVVSTLDAQPTLEGRGIIILVTGQLLVCLLQQDDGATCGIRS
jgi:hypothetical protein